VKEVGAFERSGSELECDVFDAQSTHFLAMFEGRPIGTVRVQGKTPALAARLGTLFGLPGEEHYDYAPFERDGLGIAEVSRSAVLPEHRGSKALANLWKIAHNYGRARGLTHFMSLAHIGHTDSLIDAELVHGVLERSGRLHPRYELCRRNARAGREVPELPLFSEDERRDAENLPLPLAMRLFHRFGLRACGRPVFVPSIGRIGMAMLAGPETFSKSTLAFFAAPDPAHRMD